jgi:hypothetical protein
MVAYLLAEMAEAKDNTADSVAMEERELVIDERLPGDFD